MQQWKKQSKGQESFIYIKKKEKGKLSAKLNSTSYFNINRCSYYRINMYKEK